MSWRASRIRAQSESSVRALDLIRMNHAARISPRDLAMVMPAMTVSAVMVAAMTMAAVPEVTVGSEVVMVVSSQIRHVRSTVVPVIPQSRILIIVVR